MGTNTLTNRSDGQTILDTFFNDIHQAINSDFVGRNTSGVPTSGQSLGTTAIPWGSLRANGLVINGSSVDVSQISAPPFRVVSGKTRSASNQPQFIDPAGSAGGLSFTVLGSATNLVFDTNGATSTLTTDIAKSSLTAAPSTNNTCLVNDTTAADQQETFTWGENDCTKDYITIDNVGTEITALDGTQAAFLTENGEAFICTVDTSNNRLWKCLRGFFYNSAGNPVNRASLNNNDTLTLLKLGYVFVDDDLSTIDVTYTQPVYQFDAPSAPSSGDYWFDIGNSVWKRYDGVQFQLVDRTFIGWFASDDTDCLYSRCVDFDKRYKPDYAMGINVQTTEIAELTGPLQKVNVAGEEITFGNDRNTWNITADLAPSADLYNSTEQASTTYYLYVKDTGDLVISDIEPYQRPDFYGYYHPHNPWRCVGQMYNDGSSNVTAACGYGIFDYRNVTDAHTGSGHGSTYTNIRQLTTLEERSALCDWSNSAANGTVFTVMHPGRYKVSYQDYRSGGASGYGNSLNTSQFTTDIASITLSDRLWNISVASGELTGRCDVLNLKRFDKIYPHTNGSHDATDNQVRMTVEYMGEK